MSHDSICSLVLNMRGYVLLRIHLLLDCCFVHFLVILVVYFPLTSEICRPFVLVRYAILDCNERHISAEECDSTHVLVPAYGLLDITGRELVKLLVVTEYDDSNIHGAQDGKFVGLFEQPSFPFEKRPAPSLSAISTDNGK